MPTWSLGTGMRSSPLWYQLAVLLCPWLGLILLLFASARLPTIVERLALGRTILVLPGGRVRVLLAAVVTAGLIALLCAAAGTLTFYYYPNELKPERIFSRTWIVTFSDISLMYAALWVVGKTRGVWLLVGSLLVDSRRLVAARPHRTALGAPAARMGGGCRLARVCRIAPLRLAITTRLRQPLVTPRAARKAALAERLLHVGGGARALARHEPPVGRGRGPS